MDFMARIEKNSENEVFLVLHRGSGESDSVWEVKLQRDDSGWKLVEAAKF